MSAEGKVLVDRQQLLRLLLTVENALEEIKLLKKEVQEQ